MVFSEYHWPVYDAVRRSDREPEVRLRAGHHELEVIRRLAVRLRSTPRHAGEAAVLNASATAFFDLHLQLQVEVACFVAAIDDVVVALRLALEVSPTMMPSSMRQMLGSASHPVKLLPSKICL
jgi:hypothetical protein